jgi:hypothetical protein
MLEECFLVRIYCAVNGGISPVQSIEIKRLFFGLLCCLEVGPWRILIRNPLSPNRLDKHKTMWYSTSTMVEALLTLSLKGKLMSAIFFKTSDILLKDDIVDEYLISRILRRANNPKRYSWSFTHDEYRIEILNKYKWKVEFFVSKNMPIQLSAKNLVINPERVTFH